MLLENLTIRRVCLHEVHKRADDRTMIAPTFGDGLLSLDVRARNAFASRVLAAFRSDAKCMEMTINQYGPGSVAALGSGIVGADDAEFLFQSREFANLLTRAQISRQYPGGLVVVFDGTVGHPAANYFGIMKAELHEGFLKQNNLQATFVDSLFLSPKTKLYKIGLFVSSRQPQPTLPADWKAIVYDSQLTAAQRDGAALYFHERFLGLAIPENSAHQTKAFFLKTRDFIAGSDLEENEKVDLYNSLYTYLKVDRSPTIQVGFFADNYLPDDIGDEYRQYMRRENFPETAISKDLSEVAGRLKIRRFKFPQKITLSGPPDAINDLVTVEEINGDDGSPWTQITVRGKIESQE